MKEPQNAGERLLDADHRIHKAVEQDRGSRLVKATGTLSEIGDQPQMRLLCAGMIAAGLLRKDMRLLGAGARMLLAHELAAAMKSAVKHRVDRRRPRSASGKAEEKPRSGSSSDKEESSFPSGHSAGAMSAAVAFSSAYPRYSVPALLTASAVAGAQVPRCAHYPTDVGAGLAIGAAAGGIVNGAWKLASALVAVALKRRFSVPWSR